MHHDDRARAFTYVLRDDKLPTLIIYESNLL